MSSAPQIADVLANANWLAQAFDPPSELIRFVKLNEAGYRAASFLDDRMFQLPQDVQVAPLEKVRSCLPATARRDARWIFHIGHVGSTLIARLLGELPAVLSIREPRILRDFAGLTAEQRSKLVETLQVLLSRTLRPEQTAVVKATSFVSEVAPELLAPDSRILLIYTKPKAYIASILAGENSIKELRALAHSRQARMAERGFSVPTVSDTDAHLAAAAWACEMTSLEVVAAGLGSRAMWVDFDDLLGNLGNHFQKICSFFQLQADEGELSKIAAGPLLTQYSKDVQYDYSPRLRHELLAEAYRRNRQRIEDALRMLHTQGEQFQLLRKALTRARAEA
jgi:hypothetical protein